MNYKNYSYLNQGLCYFIAMFEKVISHTATPERPATAEGNFYEPKKSRIGPGMNERIQKLRKLSFETEPSLSIERALHETAFYKENFGKYVNSCSTGNEFLDHCQKKTIYLGEGELIVGERGPKPKCVPTFPELTCHSVEDFHVLNTREYAAIYHQPGRY